MDDYKLVKVKLTKKEIKERNEKIYSSYVKKVNIFDDGWFTVDEVDCPPEVINKLLKNGYFLSIGPSSPDSYWLRISKKEIKEKGGWQNIKEIKIKKTKK